ncbi:MAG: universal stress protein [Pseudomonadota bacterium]|nr:universal stress protein [Pseudomonadota bacterium]
MELFQNILVAVEIDANGEIAFGCRAAVSQSLWLAQRNRAKLTFVHVNDMTEEMRGIADMQPQSPLAAHLERCMRLLESLAATVPDAAGSARLLFGDVAPELLRETASGGHDLLVVGTRERSGPERALFGSVANRLVRASPCPVWAVKPQQQAGFSRVLVAHDLEAGGDMALALGASLAKRQDAELHVLHVTDNRSDGHDQDQVERRSRLARRLLDECNKLGAGDRAYVAVRNGTPHVEILDYATAQAIDLLCMGMQGRTGVARLVIGNTAEKVLPDICCSLLAIRPDAQPAAGEPALVQSTSGSV